MKRYEIRWTSFGCARGGKAAKRRPAVIVSLDALNQRLETVTVCPMTSVLHPTWRSRIQVTYGGRTAEIAVDQIRAINKTRLGQKLGSLSKAEGLELRQLINEMYGEPRP